MATKQPTSDWRGLRPALEKLHWGDGLTRDEMMNQSPALRRAVMRQLPPDFRFPDAGSVVSYFERLEDSGPIDVSTFPPPEGYTSRSTTGLTVSGHRYPPSVGSGYGSGNTGSSAQTGVGRQGTTSHEEWV
jgi:hypothetical protein